MSKILLVLYPTQLTSSSTHVAPLSNATFEYAAPYATHHEKLTESNPSPKSIVESLCTFVTISACLNTTQLTEPTTHSLEQHNQKEAHSKTELKEQQKAQKRSHLLFSKSNNQPHSKSKNSHALHQPKSRNHYKHT